MTIMTSHNGYSAFTHLYDGGGRRLIEKLHIFYFNCKISTIETAVFFGRALQSTLRQRHSGSEKVARTGIFRERTRRVRSYLYETVRVDRFALTGVSNVSKIFTWYRGGREIRPCAHVYARVDRPSIVIVPLKAPSLLATMSWANGIIVGPACGGTPFFGSSGWNAKWNLTGVFGVGRKKYFEFCFVKGHRTGLLEKNNVPSVSSLRWTVTSGSKRTKPRNIIRRRFPRDSILGLILWDIVYDDLSPEIWSLGV